jgi:hypothetical protein
MADEQYRDWQNRYQPREKAYIDRLLNERLMGRQVESAGQSVDTGFALANATARREMNRYGITLDPQQADAMNRMRQLGRTSTKAETMNTARSDLQDMRLAGLNNMVGFGRDLASSTGDLAGNSAAMRAQMDNANMMSNANYQSQLMQYQAQQDAGQYGLMGTGAGLGFMVGGPWGAAIGGVGGLLAGLF